MFIDVIKLKGKNLVRVTGFRSDSIFNAETSYKQEKSFIFSIDDEKEPNLDLDELLKS